MLIGDMVSTLVERRNYTGCFMPGFKKAAMMEKFN
jgi:4-hydroxyphenylpyruvate dioxygenase